MSKPRRMHPRSLENLRGHEFRPGFDERRNVAGRPRSSPMTAALRAMADELSPDGKTTLAEAAARALFSTALKGSPAAFDCIADRLDGKPVQALRVAQSIADFASYKGPPLTEEEFRNGLGPGKGFCNEWFCRLTDEQMLRYLREVEEVLARSVETKKHLVSKRNVGA